MKDFDFILASGAEHLGEGLLKKGYRVFKSDMNHDGERFFPNTDIYVRISEVASLSKRRVIVVQNCTGSSQDEAIHFTTADRIQELRLILNVLQNPVHVDKIAHKKYDIRKIVPPDTVEVILTMQPYALQDKPFKTGETASAFHATQDIAKACDKLWLVSPVVDTDTKWASQMHKQGLYNRIDITDDLVEFGATRFGFDDYTLVAPDEGSQKRFGVPGFCKKRSDSFTIDMTGEIDVKGKNVIVIDDLTKSGSTLLHSREMLLEQGAKEVGLVVLHVTPIAKKGEKLLENLVRRSNEMVVTSNTVYTSTFCEKYPELSMDVTDKIVQTLIGL